MAFNQKNPPWQRNTGHQSISNMQAIVGFPQAQPVYNPNIGLQQQQNLSILPQIGIQQQQAIYSQTVQYPTNRPINAINFQNQPQSPATQSPVSQNSSKFNPNNRVFSGTGMVTKLQNDFGFIDDEVFFHKNTCVKGVIPKVGDRVLVDAAYNTNMPFKWNASRVQVLQSSNSNSSPGHVNSSQVRSHAQLYNNASSNQTESRSSNVRNRYSPSTRKSPERHMHRTSSSSRSKEEYDETERRRKREDRDSDRTMYREKHHERSAERGRERERSPIRKPSPKRRRVRSVPRYMVQVPKHLLTIKQADVLEMRRRYNNLYIPSDFFVSDIRWTESFPPNAPFSIRSPCQFHVMHKDVEPPALTSGGGDTSIDPPDADYLYSAKVMLMSTPPLAEFYEKCILKSSAEGDRFDDERDYMHPTRLISFLVGMRGKNETMAIGGPWSPSLDGVDPQTDPKVLIRTAVRTCRALTGIDLSSCSQWYRFVELYYRRSESYHKGRLIPPRVETVVIFLPDIRSCQPSRFEWEQLRLSYKTSLARVINCSSGSSSSSSKVDEAPVVADSSPAVTQPTPNSNSTEDVVKSSTTSTAVAPSPIAAGSAAAGVAESSVAAESVVSEQTDSPAAVAAGAAGGGAAEADASSAQQAAADTAAAVLPASSPDSETVSAEQDASAPTVQCGSDSSTGGSAPAATPAPATPAPAAAEAASTAATTPSAVSIMDTSEGAPVSETASALLLEYKKMKVADLKAELNSRNLPTDGVKAVLLSRLTDAVIKQDQQAQQELQQKAEQQEEAETVSVPAEQEVKKEEIKSEPLELETDAVMTEPMPEIKEEKEENPTESLPKPAVAGEIGEVAVKCESRSASVSRKKEPEPVKLSEKERQALERRYQLPEKPHIVVHPSRVAKSGKFDCSVISLSVLLDYRPEDTKEHSFEVALFSELFNEMLARDFGFNIYRTLYALPQTKKESDEVKKEAAVAVDGGTTKAPPPEASGALTSNGEEAAKGTVSVPTPDKGDESKKKAGHTDEKERERKPREKEITGKVLVVNSDLLLSFIYFDVSHCGYVTEKDVEDLIYTLGLNLSRSQIRKTVAKATVREMLHYRKLTDKLVIRPIVDTSAAVLAAAKGIAAATAAATATATAPTDETAASTDGAKVVDKAVNPVAAKEGGVAATGPDAPAGAEKKEQPEKIRPEIIARGNTDYKRQLKASLDQLISEQGGDGRPLQQPATPMDVDTNTRTSVRSGVVEYNGCVVDVGKLLDQVNRSETAREETEKLLVALQGQHSKLQSSNMRATNKIKDLQLENKTLARQLSEMTRASRDASQVQAEYLSVIQFVYDRVRPIAHKLTRDGSSSGGSSKRESSKETSSRAAVSKSKEKECPRDTSVGARKEDDKGTKEKSGDPTKAVPDGGASGDDAVCNSSGSETPAIISGDQDEQQQQQQQQQQQELTKTSPMETDALNEDEKSANETEQAS